MSNLVGNNMLTYPNHHVFDGLGLLTYLFLEVCQYTSMGSMPPYYERGRGLCRVLHLKKIMFLAPPPHRVRDHLKNRVTFGGDRFEIQNCSFEVKFE